jgi:S-formylglutathione hydrolase FrmB
MASRLLAFAALLCLPLAAQRRELGPPPELKNLTFAARQFDSKALGRKVDYGVYLPKDYDAEKNKDVRYPLIVWLHGLHEDHLRFNYRGGAQVLDRLTGSGKLPPLVFVTANGGRSFYVNGKESGRNEDAVAVDLIAHLEQTLRLRTGRQARAIMGVSMGGMGALNIAFHNLDKFCVVATHQAAVFPADPDNLPPRIQGLLSGRGARMGIDRIFGNPIEKELWQANNPLHLAATLPLAELKKLSIYLDVGDRDDWGFDEPNTELHELLDKRGVKHTWNLIPGGDHGWSFSDKTLPQSLQFVAAALSAEAPASRPAKEAIGNSERPDGKQESGSGK